jgi:hypothetical protein
MRRKPTGHRSHARLEHTRSMTTADSSPEMRLHSRTGCWVAVDAEQVKQRSGILRGARSGTRNLADGARGAASRVRNEGGAGPAGAA